MKGLVCLKKYIESMTTIDQFGLSSIRFVMSTISCPYIMPDMKLLNRKIKAVVDISSKLIYINFVVKRDYVKDSNCLNE